MLPKPERAPRCRRALRPQKPSQRHLHLEIVFLRNGCRSPKLISVVRKDRASRACQINLEALRPEFLHATNLRTLAVSYVEDAHAAAQIRIARNEKKLPSKTESWRPHQPVRAHKSLVQFDFEWLGCRAKRERKQLRTPRSRPSVVQKGHPSDLANAVISTRCEVFGRNTIPFANHPNRLNVRALPQGPDVGPAWPDRPRSHPLARNLRDGRRDNTNTARKHPPRFYTTFTPVFDDPQVSDGAAQI